MNNFRELKVWQKSIDLVVNVYQHLTELPNSEKFNLVAQMQRAAVSIPSNLLKDVTVNLLRPLNNSALSHLALHTN